MIRREGRLTNKGEGLFEVLLDVLLAGVGGGELPVGYPTGLWPRGLQGHVEDFGHAEVPKEGGVPGVPGVPDVEEGQDPGGRVGLDVGARWLGAQRQRRRVFALVPVPSRELFVASCERKCDW